MNGMLATCQKTLGRVMASTPNCLKPQLSDASVHMDIIALVYDGLLVLLLLFLVFRAE